MRFPFQPHILASACSVALALSLQHSQAATPPVRCEFSQTDTSAQRNSLLASVPADDPGRATVDFDTGTGDVYFVAPGGNDSWSGRRPGAIAGSTDGPFATIERARDAIRADRARQPEIESAAIYLRGGRYELKQPIAFAAQDAGIRILAFRHEHPELTGAMSIRAVTQRSPERFEAVLSTDPGRELFVGGTRQTLAFKPAQNKDGWRPATSQNIVNAFLFRPGDIEAGDGNPDLNLELLDEGRSRNVFARAVSVDPARHMAEVAPIDQRPISSIDGYRLVGNPAWIRRKGQFGWIGANHLLVLSPTDPAAVTGSGLQLPTLRNLIIFRDAHDIAVTGLRFVETETAPAEELKSAAIVLENAHNIRLSDNNFHNVGEAIRLIDSTQNFIERNIIQDTGSHGIELQDQSNGNLISANTLSDVGRVELSAAAIYLHGANFNRIAHNFVRNTSRHGIGIDNWDDTTVNRANIIEYNRLWQTNRETDDTGAIEMLGRSRIDTTSIIRYNEIAEVGTLPSSGSDGGFRNTAISGVYLDDLTSGVLVCGNRIRGAPLAAIHIHGGSKIVIRDNIVILDRPGANFLFLQGGDPSSGGQRFDFTVHTSTAQQQGRGPFPDRATPVAQATGTTPTQSSRHRVEVRFDNDAIIDGEDRDLFVSKIKVGTQEFLATDPRAHYAVDDRRILPGQVALPWNGALIWELPDTLFGPSDIPISVFAWGNPAGGVGAHFTVAVDGAHVGDGFAGSPPDEMQDNQITRNIVYATAPGKSYYKSLRGGAPRVSANDYFDITGARRLPASPVNDTAPISAEPLFVDPAKGDFRLRASSPLRARGFGNLPVLSGNGT